MKYGSFNYICSSRIFGNYELERQGCYIIFKEITPNACHRGSSFVPAHSLCESSDEAIQCLRVSPSQHCVLCCFWYSTAHYKGRVLSRDRKKHFMKQNIHPESYRMVIFHDNSSEARFLVGSTVESSETDKWEDGNEYPIVRVDVSSDSHPFYTGQEKVMDTAGRVERFKSRAGKVSNRRKKQA